MIGMTNLNDSDPFNRPLTAGELAAYIRERNAATGSDDADQRMPMPAEACTELGSGTTEFTAAARFWTAYLALLLVICALGLFFVTAVAGRVWCGFSCPQTVYTQLFMCLIAGRFDLFGQDFASQVPICRRSSPVVTLARPLIVSTHKSTPSRKHS